MQTPAADFEPLRDDGGFVLLILGAAFLFLVRSVADPDLWGHVRFGQLILESGAIPREDPFSYLSEGWINHEWLSEVVFAAVYNAFGTLGLDLLRLGVGLAVVLLLYRHACRRGLGDLAAGAVTLVATLALVPGLNTVRPQMFTYLFFTLLTLILESVTREPSRWRRLWLVPAVLAVWINFHGGVLAGAGLLVAWALGWAVLGTRPAHPKSRTAPGGRYLLPLATAATGLAGLLLNPYGAELPAFLLQTATVPRPEIIEWQPLRLQSPKGIIYLVMAGGSGAAVLSGFRRRHALPLALLALTAVLPLTAQRHLGLFAIGFVVFGSASLAAVWRGRFRRHESTRGRSGIVINVALGVALVTLGVATISVGCVPVDPRVQSVPARAVATLQGTGVNGRMATPFGWGEYVIWHLGPALQVSMDGRRETVYPEPVYQDYLRFSSGTGERWDAILEEPAAELVLVPRSQAAFNLLELRRDWELVYGDSTAGVFARSGSDLGATVRAAAAPELPPDGRGLCFP